MGLLLERLFAFQSCIRILRDTGGGRNYRATLIDMPSIFGPRGAIAQRVWAKNGRCVDQGGPIISSTTCICFSGSRSRGQRCHACRGVGAAERRAPIIIFYQVPYLFMIVVVAELASDARNCATDAVFKDYVSLIDW